MDYKEKYEQGLECIQEILSGAGVSIKTSILRKRLQSFFPELKESEEEEIMKELKHYLEVRRCQTKDDEEYINCNHFLAWLEKPADIEPKFHPGDWITDGQLTCKVSGAISKSYNLHLYDDDYSHFETDIQSVDKRYRLWTIADAKDGDVLISSTCEKPFVYNGKHTSNSVGTYFGLDYNNELFFTDGHGNNWSGLIDVHPATKEQRDALLEKLLEKFWKLKH